MTVNELKALIDASIYDNTTGAITGGVLNNILKQILSVPTLDPTAIAANTAAIAQNTTDIASNTSNIATNTTNIAAATATANSALAAANSVSSAVAANTAAIAAIGELDAVSVYGISNAGVTDVGAALQNAINDCNAKHKDLFLAEGTYNIGTTVIYIPSNFRLRGAGMFRTQIKRTANIEANTIDISGSVNVTIQDIGILYRPTTQATSNAGAQIIAYYRLGYGHAGFAVRNGSHNVQLIRCGLDGPMNRAFHLLNCYDVTVDGCVQIGGGDAGLRVVSDSQAGNASSIYADNPNGGKQLINESTTGVKPVARIRIINCTFHGAVSLTSDTNVISATKFNNVSGNYGQFYGLNLATVNAGDAINDIFIDNCHVAHTEYQGFEIGGNVNQWVMSNCTARYLGPQAIVPPTNGVAFLIQSIQRADAGMANVIQGALVNCHATVCFQGFYVLDCYDIGLYNCTVNGFAAGQSAYLTSTNGGSAVGNTRIVFSGCRASNPYGAGSAGFSLNAANHCIIEGCVAIGCTAGVNLLASCTTTLVCNNQLYGNTNNTLNSGTNNVFANNQTL